MIFIGLMMIHTTPQLRNNLFVSLLYRDNRVHTQQTLQQRQTAPTLKAEELLQNKINRQLFKDKLSQNKNYHRSMIYQSEGQCSHFMSIINRLT